MVVHPVQSISVSHKMKVYTILLFTNMTIATTIRIFMSTVLVFKVKTYLNFVLWVFLVEFFVNCDISGCDALEFIPIITSLEHSGVFIKYRELASPWLAKSQSRVIGLINKHCCWWLYWGKWWFMFCIEWEWNGIPSLLIQPTHTKILFLYEKPTPVIIPNMSCKSLIFYPAKCNHVASKYPMM